MIMRKLLFILTFMLASVVAAQSSQPVYTRHFADRSLVKAAKRWYTSGAWRNGFMAAKPHKSVNLTEWYSQYQKNKVQWDALFSWLANNDVTTISAGKHPIEGTNMVVSVEDSKNGELATRQSESHYHHIDFQYVVKGTERFGIIDHLSSTANCGYRPDVMHYDYDVKKARFYDSVPDEFFIFFPCDWHIAKVATEKDDQNIRVIVIKVDYVD
jgi:biofilm protein TabA